MKLTYRADIDGVRAIAVLAVLFYHADIKSFSGGYVGVDIFFVISGYLITTIILRELDDNEFSLARFYERRIRRIFPALFTILTATLLVSSIFFSANEFQEFGKSLVATTFFSSNILFWTQSGYFEGPSELKPLLHTWSLAVEEQYYIFFPLLLAFLARYLRPRLAFVLTGIAFASFALNLYGINHDPSGAFYLVHMRVWELLIGSILATKIISTKINPFIYNLLGGIGLGMLIAPIFLYTTDTPFPGMAATLPTLGTALVIYSGDENKTVVGRILSFWPLVFIGQISYSLYLLHWPFIVFAKYYAILELKPIEIAIILFAILILSTLSWRFIETPFRQRTFLKRRSIFQFATITMLLIMSIGSIIYLKGGLPNRFSSRQAAITQNTDVQWKNWGKCDLDPDSLPSPLELCAIGANTSKPVFLLWGDSHARALATSVHISASQANKTGVVAYTSGCPPLLGIDREGQKPCGVFNTTIIDYIRDHPNLETIILASRWALSAEGTRYKNEEGKSLILVNAAIGPTETDTNAALFELGLNQTVNTLLAMGRRVVIITQVPEIGYDVPSAFSIAQRTGRDLNKIISPSFNDYLDRNRIVTVAIVSVATNNNVEIVEPSKALCTEEICLVVSGEQPLYRDDDHLSTFGAQYISHIFDPVFEGLR
ncbi:MAG: acyltransferase [Chloroflexi bacterium]|nr:acyltransferase [Chloroflexota bacterium]